MDFNLREFIDNELYPIIWERADEIFPEMYFKKKGDRWISNYHIGGERSSNNTEQTNIYSGAKHLIKDWSGDCIDYIAYIQKQKGIQFWEALKYLCQRCNIEVPNKDPEYEERREKEIKLEVANTTFKKALWREDDPQASAVLQYMRDRGWSDEHIREAELGYINNENKKLLPEISNNSNIGEIYTLTIPYRAGSSLKGFKVRDINHTPESKTDKYKNTAGTNKGNLFGLSVGDKEIVIVEGELDALHSRVMGKKNVVSTAGGAIGNNQLDDIIKRKIKRVTLLFDNDESGRKYTERSITLIEKAGISIYVANLPEKYKDTDAYLKDHSIEEWEEYVEKAIPVSLWKYHSIVGKYSSRCKERENGELLFKEREDFLNEVQTLINSPYTPPYEREGIYKELEEQEDPMNFKVSDFRDYVDQAYLRLEATRKKEVISKASSQIKEYINNGKVDDALRIMKEVSSIQDIKDRSLEFSKLFSNPTKQDIIKTITDIPEGIPTGIVFDNGKHREELTLNSGITFICGYRGHCKTTFLNNIAINEAKRNIGLQNNKRVLYFSYEVSKGNLSLDMLNTYLNMPKISQNPFNSLRSYYRGGKSFKYFSKDFTEAKKGEFLKKESEFFDKILCGGALTIIEEPYKVEDLLKAIKYYLSFGGEVSMICIDYAQSLYSEDFSRQRTEEIKKIVNDLKDFANREKLPIVLACQFNREVNSPASVDTKNIGEGGDFERIADTCIGLFNLKELRGLNNSNSKEEKETKNILKELLKEEEEVELKPMDNKLFVRLLKRRYGYFPIDIILEWEGKTKYITPNYPEALEVTPIQEELDFPL